MTESSDDIPIVDLSADPASVASVIRDACVRHGFFYLTNHGVPRSLVDGMYDASRAFFALPESAKRTVLASNDANNRGWTPLGEETLDPATQTRGDTKEGYYIGREIDPSSDEYGKPLRGANQWPDEAKLGLRASLPGGFREPMMRYHAALTNLCDSLMPSFAEALGLNRAFFEDKFRFPTATLRPLRYAAQPSRPAEGVLGAGAHSDYGVLTVLWTDGAEGLEILKDDVWYPVKPLPSHMNAFICNVGDLCERWTNGVFKSTVHRVVTRDALQSSDARKARGYQRHSCAFFWEPDFDTRVEPLPACVAENPPVRYEPTTYGEYILAKYRATHADFERRRRN